MARKATRADGNSALIHPEDNRDAAIGHLVEVELAEAGPNSLHGRLLETIAS